MIGESDLLPAERDLALRIFGRVARAEAKVHGVPLDTVGFHEVGAVDSIVDIVGAAVCFCWLQPDRVIASPVNTGSGFVRCQHGLLPVPAPATAEILMEGAVPAYAKGSPGERTTPTGAAIVAEIAAVYGVLPAMTIRSIGYGVGTKDFDAPNILRMIIGEAVDAQHGAFPLSSAVGKEGSPDLADVAVGKEGSPNPADVAVGKEQSPDPEDEVIVLEANLDDMTGEAAGYLLGRLLGAGARDAFHTPVYMKKNRPGMLLTVLADPADVEALERLIFQESSTIGIRKTRAVRSVMHRAFDAVEVAGNRIAIKVCTWQDICKAAPEYEDVRAAAERTGLPFRTVYRMAEQAWAARP